MFGGDMSRKSSAASQDNAWKDTVRDFFPEFIQLFFPAVFAEVDWSRGYEMLDKELARLTRKHRLGSRLADFLVRVFLNDGTETWLLIHLEIQASPETGFAKRIYVYNYRIFDRHDCEVVSLVLLTDARRSYRPERFQIKRWGFELVCRFPVVKISDFADRWEELMALPNPMAVAVMAYLRIWQAKNDDLKKLSFKRELIRLLYERKYERERILALLRFIDWIIVLPEELEQKLEDDIHEFEEEQTMPFVSRWELRAEARGEARGEAKGLRNAILLQLAHKFGELDDDLKAQIEALSAEKSELLLTAMFDFTELEDLTKWLKRRKPRKAKNGSASLSA